MVPMDHASFEGRIFGFYGLVEKVRNSGEVGLGLNEWTVEVRPIEALRVGNGHFGCKMGSQTDI
ncbi:hypothetical protein PLICRDRAFT_44822 [Plicaturopsis crispa FD-325 SS-3]|nr:hypothetical protein PLICRDRAFT_44822 [Plicaturopsis crispa FD-325 SS-3]